MQISSLRLFLSSNPLLRPLFYFMIGIILADFFYPVFWINGIYFFIPFTIFILLLHRKLLRISLTWKWIERVALFLLFMSCGIGVFVFQTQKNQGIPSIILKQANAIKIRLTSSPQIRNNTIKAEAEIEAVRLGKKWITCKAGLLCRMERTSTSAKLNYGDQLLICETVKPVKAPANPGEFDYKQWLARKQIFLQTYLRDQAWKHIASDQGNPIIALATETRKTCVQKFYTNGWKERESAVAAALILGATDQLEPQLIQAYSVSGVLHVLSVSGLHVSIVFIIFGKILAPLNRRKNGTYIRVILLLSLIWIYALVTGLSPAVLRAACMISFVIAGEALKKSGQTFNLLCASALLLLAINPQLLFDIGFQLSFLAVAGIVLCNPLVEVFITPKNRIAKHIWQLTSVSLTAQAATLPLTLFYFQQFPLYFLPANLLLIPLSTLAMYAGLAFLCFSSIPFLGNALSWLANKLFWLLNEAVLRTEQLPAAAISTNVWSALEVCLLILIIVGIFYFLVQKNIRIVYAVVFSLLVLTGCIGWKRQQQNKQQKIIVHSLSGATAISFIDGTKQILLTDSATYKSANAIEIHCLAAEPVFGCENDTIMIWNNTLRYPLKSMPQQTNLHTAAMLAQFGNWRILQINRDKYTSKFVSVQAILMCQNNTCNLEQVLEETGASLVIADGSNGAKAIARWEKICKKQHIQFVNVKENGAFTYNLLEE
ncbi:MAG: ComEC/Rec2 family competence protein [Bacteroidia bacterium]